MAKRTFFPQLHTHDEHSIKDGCSTVETYADMVKDLGGGSLAITNHGMAAGYARQYFACKERGIKPIFGMEAYVNEHRRKPVKQTIDELKKADKKAKGKDKAITEKLVKAQQFLKERFRPSPHSIVLAKNLNGYRNLVRMSSDSWLNGYYYAPRTDTKFLAEHAEGLIYSTACIGGHIPRIVRDNFDLAVKEARRLKGVFEDGAFFVELMMTEYEPQRETNALMIRLANEINAPMILTCDVHYARKKDGLAQDVLLLMRDKKTLKDKEGAGEGVWQFDAKDLWWRSLEDVAACWKNFHSDYMDKETFLESVRTTYRLADEIEDIEFDTSLKLPGVFANPENVLRELILEGIRWRKERGEIPAQGVSLRDYVDRARREMDVINAKGFAEYFLILHDVCKAARAIGARMGPGRGSAGGSLIAFLCRITEIDPLRFNLLFERFLDIDRPDPPDIDLDFSPEHRDQVKDYIDKRYPATATIGSYATFKPRGTIGDVARVFGHEHWDMTKLTKQLGTDADRLTWEEIFELWPEVEEWCENNEEAFGVIKTLKGLISHRGKNAAGVLIAPASALDDLPMIFETDTKGNRTTVTAFPDSQGDGVTYKGRELTRLGYLKMDILGVRNLNIAPQAVEILRRETGEEVVLETLELNDPEALRVAESSVIPGVFQLDTDTTRPILSHVGIDSFMDLVMVTALCRPGPLKNNIHRAYAKSKANDSWKTKIHADLVPVLAETRGLMILQEDVMFVVQVLGGLTLTEANACRKIIGKKHDEAAFKPWEIKFVAGGTAKGYDPELLKETWSKIITFAHYGFPKAHAVAYMLTAYRQLYMLAHHPLPYFAALLAQTPRAKKEKDGDKLTTFMRAAQAHGCKILPPSAQFGTLDFDVQDGTIRYGLEKIKGVASGAEAIMECRPFSTLEELVDKVERRRANARVFSALILAGAFDDLPYEGDVRSEPVPEREGIEYRNSLIHRYHQIRKAKDDPERFSYSVLLEKERDLLGSALSWWTSNKVSELRDLKGLETIAYSVAEDMTQLSVLVEVARVREHRTKKGTMAFLTLADETGTLDNVILWAGEFGLYKDVLKKGRFILAHLKRRASHNPDYGKWSYYLSERHTPAFADAQQVLRRTPNEA